jgi:hypothetical protein
MKKEKISLWLMTVAVLMTLVFSPSGGAEVAGSDSENLLLNPDFENLEGLDKPESWSTGPEWSVDIEEPYGGKNCMRTSTAWSWLLQEVSAKPEQYYSFTAYVKSNIKVEKKTDFQNTFLWLDYLDKEGQIVKEEYGAIFAVSSWRLYGRVILSPTKTEKIRVKLGKRLGEGNVWFDRVELRPLSENLLLNPDFETLAPSGNPEFWGSVSGWSVDTKEPHRGKNYMQGTIAWQWLWQTIPARPKSFLTLRAHLRSDITTAREVDYENTIIGLVCIDGEGNVVKKEERTMVAPSSWRENEVAIYTPAGTTAVKIMLAKRLGEGSLWVDDLQMRRLPSYLRIRILRAFLEDKPFFIFYFSVYLILVISLLRVVLKR